MEDFLLIIKFMLKKFVLILKKQDFKLNQQQNIQN